MISWVRAGEWSDVEEEYSVDAADWVYTTATNHPKAFALIVKGESMLPVFCDGDTIIVEPEREAISGNYVITKKGNEQAAFKRLRIDGPSTYLEPLNPDRERYKPWDMTGIEFTFIGVVVEKVMKF